MPTSGVLKELGALRSLTKVKDAGEGNSEFQIRVYARKLSEYPADAVKFALRQWADYSPWWPSWHELKSGLDQLCETRLMKRDAIGNIIEAYEAADEEQRQIEAEATHG